MKVIFLDIDGVLNRLGSIEQQRTIHTFQGFVGFEPELVERFNNLVSETGAVIVLSSSWRNSKNWRSDMFQNGLNIKKLIDRTPHLPGKIRGYEIDAWLKVHANVENYVIVDDDNDMLPWHGRHMFQTNYASGLTIEIAEKIKTFLNELHPVTD